MPRVLIESQIIRHRPGDFRGILKASGFDLIRPDATGPIAPADLVALLPEVDAVIMGVGEFSEAMFASAPRLRVVARTGVGFDRIDLGAATRHGVVVTITPGANHEGVAEHTLALILALARNVTTHDANLRAGRWDRSPLPTPLRGRTLGIVGTGRIGCAVATRALALGMRVVAYTPRPRPVPSLEFVSFDAILGRADIVSLHLPLSDETRGLMNRVTLARMRQGSILINTSRGGLIVEDDLADALESGHLAGAGLDVFDSEPPPPAHRFWRIPNLVATPHMAGIDSESVDEMAHQAAQIIVQLRQGEWPEAAVVNSDVRPQWRWDRP